jgi:hypothetical protein
MTCTKITSLVFCSTFNYQMASNNSMTVNSKLRRMLKEAMGSRLRHLFRAVCRNWEKSRELKASLPGKIRTKHLLHPTEKCCRLSHVTLRIRRCPWIDTPWTMCSKIIANPYHNSSVVTRVPSSEPDLGLDITLNIIVCCKQWGHLSTRLVIGLLYPYVETWRHK